MSSFSLVVVLAIVSTQTVALSLSRAPQGMKEILPGSRPGSAKPPKLPKESKWPYDGRSSKREGWGDRLVAAVQATATERECKGFVSFGDFTWCAKVMPKETEGARNPDEPYGPVLAMTASNRATLESQPNGEQLLGITMGIQERDLWSELMSNRYNVPTKLYDCFVKSTKGGPIYHENLTAIALGKKACPSWRNGICYNAEYDAKKVCVGEKSPDIKDDKTFVSLRSLLKDRSPLSTHVKMDIEGSEWEVLSELLTSDEDIDKIRSLDMEAHFRRFKKANSTAEFEKEMEQAVRTFELISKRFAVVGSTVQATHEAFERRLLMQWPIDAHEPMVYPTKGFSLDTFTVSMVNKRLL